MSTVTELREQAGAKFKEAADLVAGKSESEITGELGTRFDAIMAEAKSLDQQFAAAAGRAGEVITLQDRLSFYAGKAMPGSPPLFGGGIAFTGGPGFGGQKSLGQQFVESQPYQDVVASGALKDDNSQQQWKSAPFVPETKATTDVLSTGTGPGGALVTPDYLPGILPLPQRPLTVRDLFSQDTTGSDILSYARQTSFDNGTTAVAQATSLTTGLKPQSSIGWARQTSPIETIATWMAATRRQLADVGQTRSLIDNQGTLMLRLEEENQLVNGNGTSPNLRGLLNTSGLQLYDVSGVSGNTRVNLDALRTARRLVKTGPSRFDADSVIVNPVDSENYDLMVDVQERYRAGDPFGSNFANQNAGGGDPTPIWRLRRVESEAIAAGHALVGAFRPGATVFQREPITILTSDSHSDFFIRNLVAVLFEERFGFAVFFPSAFVYVTLHSW